MSVRRFIHCACLVGLSLGAGGCAVYARPVPGVGVTVAPAPVYVEPPVYGGLGWGGYYGPAYHGPVYRAPHYRYSRPMAPAPVYRARPFVSPRGRPF